MVGQGPRPSVGDNVTVTTIIQYSHYSLQPYVPPCRCCHIFILFLHRRSWSLLEPESGL